MWWSGAALVFRFDGGLGADVAPCLGPLLGLDKGLLEVGLTELPRRPLPLLALLSRPRRWLA